MLITKSKFSIGLNCPRCFWKAMNEATGTENTQQAIEIRELAKNLFIDDNSIDLSKKDVENNIKATLECLPLNHLIYEAGFKVDNLYARVDILVPNDEENYDIIQVESSSKIKDDNIYQVAFQKYVCERAGISIRDCKVIHLYGSYVKKGDTDLKELFVTINITDKVEDFYPNIPRIIEKLDNICKLEKAPVVELNKYLLKEYPCEFNSDCWSFLPKDNASNLYRINKDKVLKLFKNNIFKTIKVPDVTLNKNQLIQKKAIIDNETYINSEGINNFISKLQYPIYYLNIETFNEAIPRFYGTKPYAQIPFQYSIQVQDEKGKLDHHDFSHKDNTSPKKSILLSILDVLGNKGSIVVFNEKFQKTRLNELAELYPEYRMVVDSILERIVDLSVPFSQFDYYNPLQNGSCLIRNILPAITGKSYEKIDVAKGEDNSTLYLKATFGVEFSEEEKDNVYRDLLEYCKVDTQAMVDIIEALKKILD